MSTNAEPESDRIADREDRWVGRTIANKFKVAQLIGAGAMGRVYRAEQLALGKPIAIKILHRHLGGDPRIAKRFHREAQAASRLSHPNSVQIIDFGEAGDGTLYIAMELLEGEDLQTIIDNDAPMSPKRIADLMRQALTALDEAHHAGIIHRDLKPENVLVLPIRGGERVKVCDFGIAKIIESEGRSTAITRDGYVCGTPEYMAPEQARGDKIDRRADVYSAGVMLYQLLCGQVPFKAESALGTITKHLMERPTHPRKVRPRWGIPRSLEQVALKALAKDPDDRYPTAAAMVRAIDEALVSIGDLATTRLGHGVFAVDGDDDELGDDGALSSTQEVIASVVPASRRWMYAVALGLALIAAAIVYGARRAEVPVAPTVATSPELSAPVPTPEPSPHSESIEPPVEDPTTPVDVTPTHAPTEAPTPPRTPRTGPRPSRSPPATPSALERGGELMMRGDLDGAIASFQQAARADPRDPRAQKQLGRAHMRAGNVPQGIAAYRRYLGLSPNAPDRAIIERILAQHGG